MGTSDSNMPEDEIEQFVLCRGSGIMLGDKERDLVSRCLASIDDTRTVGGGKAKINCELRRASSRTSCPLLAAFRNRRTAMVFPWTLRENSHLVSSILRWCCLARSLNLCAKLDMRRPPVHFANMAFRASVNFNPIAGRYGRLRLTRGLKTRRSTCSGVRDLRRSRWRPK